MYEQNDNFISLGIFAHDPDQANAPDYRYEIHGQKLLPRNIVQIRNFLFAYFSILLPLFLANRQ